MTVEELIEQLAEKEHEHWRFWMTLFLNKLDQQPDGSLIIPSERVEVYQKLTQTFYKELQDRDKKPYLNAVSELLPIIEEYVSGKLENAVVKTISHGAIMNPLMNPLRKPLQG